MPTKKYMIPAIETLDSSQILEMIGPVQGYGGFGGGGGAHGGITPPIPNVGGPKTPSSNY